MLSDNVKENVIKFLEFCDFYMAKKLRWDYGLEKTEANRQFIADMDAHIKGDVCDPAGASDGVANTSGCHMAYFLAHLLRREWGILGPSSAADGALKKFIESKTA